MFVYAQNVGDTIVIESFNYTQTYGVNQWSPRIRDTIIDFSILPNQPIEKVLMLIIYVAKQFSLQFK